MNRAGFGETELAADFADALAVDVHEKLWPHEKDVVANVRQCGLAVAVVLPVRAQ